MSMLEGLPPEKVEELKALYAQLMENEDVYWMAPAQGFIGDWFLMYWELHNKCLEFMNQTPYNTPLIERKKYEQEKCKDL